MTIGRMANILSVQDKLIRLLAEEGGPGSRLGARAFLQDSHAESLNWSDARLAFFLEQKVRPKFGVVVSRKNIKLTMNGSSTTVGDLAIAIYLAVERRHKTGKVMATPVSV